uniref:Rho GTPase activating protein 19 n=1 Tax=Tetraodon nigroviridis TaxID=99883 RepID=H3CDA2_TETNG
AESVIFNPDFFVEKLRHENPDVFLELVLSNISRLIDLPGTEFAQLLGEEGPKTPTGGNGGFFRSFNFLKRKDKGLFGSLLSESSIAQIYQLIEFLTRNLHVEGLFRVPGNSLRQQALKELLNGGADVDLESGDFHPHDVASVLKSFLGELPEPLLTHRHFHAHLKIADLTLLDEHGNKTSAPNKERQMEDHTARQQDKNKMSAFNLALMFAPHVLWPRHMNAVDLRDHLDKLNSSMAFLIKHSQRVFRAPLYLRDYARLHYTGVKGQQAQVRPQTFPRRRRSSEASVSQAPPPSGPPAAAEEQQYTEAALKELFRHVNHSMPDSAKKKKLVRQLVQQTGAAAPDEERRPAPNRKHARSRSLGALIKRKARGDPATADGASDTPPPTASAEG